MDFLILYLITWWKTFDKGEMDLYVDPDPPADLGDPLTQDEIDFVKKLKKEMEERFAPLP